MAHSKDIKDKLRAAFIFDGINMEQAAKKFKLSIHTISRWKREAKSKGDDWDKQKSANLLAGDGIEAIARQMLADYINQHKSVMDDISQGDLSVLEHESLSVSIICDRGVSHELVRHRIAAYSQESTRYCNYAGKPMEFIKPCWFDEDPDSPRANSVLWYRMMKLAAQTYNSLIAGGWTPQQARSVLPNSLKTEIVVTANLREWLHIFDLRTAKAAHPQMRQVMEMVKAEFQRVLPLFI